ATRAIVAATAIARRRWSLLFPILFRTVANILPLNSSSSTANDSESDRCSSGWSLYHAENSSFSSRVIVPLIHLDASSSCRLVEALHIGHYSYVPASKSIPQWGGQKIIFGSGYRSGCIIVARS